jgi:2-deoxy-D-gluconate 3-dehydrogenase
MLDLKGKVAIVTGASRGIGGAMAVGLAQAGAKLLLVSRGAPEAPVVAALEATGQTFAHFAADMSKLESVPLVVQAALDHFGKIDILVNNAGMTRRVNVFTTTEEDWDAVLNTNLKIPFFLGQACARQMIEQKTGGKIINTCSLLSFQGGLFVPAYAASKHGIAGITRAMANELAPQGINVNGIAPGYIKTELTGPLQQNETRYNSLLSRIPQGRWGEPSDLTGAVVFLASDAANYINGHILAVDGGWLSN